MKTATEAPKTVPIPNLYALEALDAAVREYLDLEDQKPDLCAKCDMAAKAHRDLMKQAWLKVRQAHEEVHSNQVTMEFQSAGGAK